MNLVFKTYFGSAPLAQLVRAFDSHSKGRRFESCKVHLRSEAHENAHWKGAKEPYGRTCKDFTGCAIVITSRMGPIAPMKSA